MFYNKKKHHMRERTFNEANFLGAYIVGEGCDNWK